MLGWDTRSVTDPFDSHVVTLFGIDHEEVSTLVTCVLVFNVSASRFGQITQLANE